MFVNAESRRRIVHVELSGQKMDVIRIAPIQTLEKLKM